MKRLETNTRSRKVARNVDSPINARQHVIPLGNGWVVKREGAKSFTVITDNKRQAISIATSIAKTNKTEIVIHGKDGNIEGRKSYAS